MDTGPLKKYRHKRPASYLGAGIAIGVAIGVAMDNIGAGIAIGIAIGVALSRKPGRKNPHKEDGEE
ncbi:MAG: hypothetical protein HOD43_12295 [Candidatus Marinimicrobia bacterium]|jgi:zinc transporter ZupT|nr:hypothetical protein [Candidatus Neomarinimicrobiota bacterium]MBT3632462.1 hypothetical protein [Candidatus Neomarinimicrobiota bacterium]MBT3826049.1 hypothetical protein [Candidatus Neomarinimicrobiota bacterium]MBT4132285.1 hypothetical protein [Candidatus Neomarinimicrobiota bacterium]MBT4296570.1 hypothetical protein [Candidatus Neomarinimicrobiota bacterium]